ncbi:hypothetical protein K525DRAFT_249528 [Schizophyllum commune Loenen D]|nr:hypothetical protein K525DRAFT_249528 [Schizophyllum commune Loenen D]
MDSSQHAPQIYTKNLLPLREGFPLWIPEPDANLPMCYKETGVRIGDVGILGTDGRFQFMLNLCSAPDDPVQQHGVPAGFERMNMGYISHIPSYFNRNGAFVHSANFCRQSAGAEAGADAGALSTSMELGISFNVVKDEGAILALPQGGSRRNAQNLKAFRTQIERHSQEWYAYARDELGWVFENNSLYLVTGVDKAPTWGALAFHRAQKAKKLLMKFTAIAKATAGLNYEYEWQHLPGQTVRQGPDDGSIIRGDNGLPVENQCVFVRGYRIRMCREKWPRKSKLNVKVTDYTGSGNFGKPLKSTSPTSPSESSTAKGKGRQAPASNGCADDLDVCTSPVDAGDHLDDHATESGQEEEAEILWEPIQPMQAANALNQCLLDRTECSVAFTHDDVWMSAPDDVDVVLDLEGQGVLAHYNFETTGTGE